MSADWKLIEVEKCPSGITFGSSKNEPRWSEPWLVAVEDVGGRPPRPQAGGVFAATCWYRRQL